MLKVKIKYINPVELKAICYVDGEKYITVADKANVASWLRRVGATTMGYKVDGYKFVASTDFLTMAKLEAGVKMRFYNAKGKCVAKWLQGILVAVCSEKYNSSIN